MQAWDLRTHHIPAPPETKGRAFSNREVCTSHFWGTEAGKAAYAHAQNLAAKGWELVSVIPETMATHYRAAGLGGINTGYILFFRRPREV